MDTCFHVTAGRCGLVAVSLVMAACQPTEAPSGEPELGKAPAGTAVTVTAAFPDSAGRDTTVNVQVTGTGFDRGSSIAFQISGVDQPKLRVNSTVYGSTSKLTANVTIAADAPVAQYDIAVTTSKGKKGIGTELFAVLAINPVPGSVTIDGANASGDAAGTTCDSKGGNCRPFVWRGAGQPVTLPIPAGSCSGRAMVINQADVLAGRSSNCTTSIPLKWVPTGPNSWTMQALGTIPGADTYYLFGINEAGTIVGSSHDPSSKMFSPVVWDPNGQARRLSSPFSEIGTSEAMGVNEAGLIAGYVRITGGFRPVVWLTDGTPVPLLMPDSASYAFSQGINDQGSVVGEIGIPGGYRAAIWRMDPAHTNTWLPPVYLAPLAGNSAPYDINNAEQVVGQAAGQGFYWDAVRGMIPLPPWSNNWTGTANAITDPTAGTSRIFGQVVPPGGAPGGSIGVWWPIP